ncbi:hypothetical protein MMC25_001280 [Agyrium rufum]|nr:hypothetical protein [Agyrium rufum]
MRQNKRDFGSVENLRPHKNYGRPPTLKEDAVEALLQWRRENPKASLPDMAQYLSSDFKLKVACSTIRDTLARASGTSKVKPRRAKKPSDSVGKDWRQELQMYLAAAGTINHSSSQATSSGTSP